MAVSGFWQPKAAARPVEAHRGPVVGIRRMPSFGEVLRRYRRAAGLTQEQLGERASMDGGYIGKIESGVEGSDLRVSTIRKLYDALPNAEPEPFAESIGLIRRGHTADNLEVAVASVYALANMSDEEKRAVEVLLRASESRARVI